MEKIRRKKIGRSIQERIGLPTGLLNRDREEIHTGDFIRMHGHDTCDGIVLWHRYSRCYGLFYGLWYGDRNPYDPDCYGKYIEIPSDNGMRMELEPIAVETSAIDTL